MSNNGLLRRVLAIRIHVVRPAPRAHNGVRQALPVKPLFRSYIVGKRAEYLYQRYAGARIQAGRCR